MIIFRAAVWESGYLDVFDAVLLHSDIYTAVRDFHVNAMKGRQTVLDSGCGTGNVTIKLLENGQEVHALDISRKALDKTELKCEQYDKGFHPLRGNAEQTAFEDEAFDGVSSMFVVYYVNDYAAYLRETYRVLKKGGVFALTGRSSSDKMELILQSYGQSLVDKGLVPGKLDAEWEIYEENFLSKVTKAVVVNHTFEQMKDILEGIGFRDVKEYPNPYLGQCYSLIARK